MAFGPVGPRATAPAEQASIGYAMSYACRADGRTVVTWTLTNHGAPTSISAATTTIAGRRFQSGFGAQATATVRPTGARDHGRRHGYDDLREDRGAPRGISGKDRPSKPCAGGPATTTPTTGLPCLGPGPKTCKKPAPSSILPPPSSPPDVTVNLYLEALNGHNTALAEQLLEPARRTVVEQLVDSMLTNVVSLTDVRITHVTMLPVDREAHLATGMASPPATPRPAVVSVTFNLHQKRQISMTDGPTVWGYTVVRRNSASRWLIAGEGVG